jgi:predicted O-methyltransferase YrrM
MNHFYKSVVGWCDFEDVYSEAVANAPNDAKFAEIGSWRGQSAAYLGVEIINSGKNISLVCVDTFKGSPQMKIVGDGSYDEIIAKEGSCYKEFLKNIKPVSRVITPLEMTSEEASKLYPDNHFDFVFIDAGHTYEDVILDLKCWLPKIKSGGVIAGHDIHWPGVTQALREVFGDNGYEKISAQSWRVKVP